MPPTVDDPRTLGRLGDLTTFTGAQQTTGLHAPFMGRRCSALRPSALKVGCPEDTQIRVAAALEKPVLGKGSEAQRERKMAEGV